MKEVVGFVSWLWLRLERWQKMFILAVLVQVIALFLTPPWAFWLSWSGAVIVLAYLFKWAVWDGVSSAWRKYQQERNQLFTTIRDSDS